MMMSVSIIVVIISIFIWLLSILKLIEIVIAIPWVLKNGKSYKEEMLNLVWRNRSSRTIAMVEFIDVEEKHKIQWPILWKLVLKYIKSDSPTPSWLKIYGQIVSKLYRQPMLVLILVVLIMGFQPYLVFWLKLKMVVPDDSLVSLGQGILVLGLILFELLYLLIRRLYLGFTDNFRSDLEENPLLYYKRKYLSWSISEFVLKFVKGISTFLITSILGFASVYFEAYQICAAHSFEGFLPSTPVQLQLIYFSVVTIATVGYGDIYPGNDVVQFVSMLEIFSGIGMFTFLIFALSNTFNLEKGNLGKVEEHNPRKKWRELRREDKEEIRKRIREGNDNIYELGKEFDYSPSQIAGVKAALNREKKRDLQSKET